MKTLGEETNVSIETKIIFGLILIAVIGVFTNIVGTAIKTQTEKVTNNKKAGMLVYGIIIIIWYFYILTYWLDLYSESLE